MINLEFSGKIRGQFVQLERVTKTTARKAYNAGKIIYLQSCKFSPIGVWSEAIDVKNEGESFENVVNSFEYYNCSNETGKYASFYLNTLEK